MKPFARILERDGVQVVVIADRCDRSDNDEIKMLFDPDVEGGSSDAIHPVDLRER